MGASGGLPARMLSSDFQGSVHASQLTPLLLRRQPRGKLGACRERNGLCGHPSRWTGWSLLPAFTQGALFPVHVTVSQSQPCPPVQKGGSCTRTQCGGVLTQSPPVGWSGFQQTLGHTNRLRGSGAAGWEPGARRWACLLLPVPLDQATIFPLRLSFPICTNGRKTASKLC